MFAVEVSTHMMVISFAAYVVAQLNVIIMYLSLKFVLVFYLNFSVDNSTNVNARKLDMFTLISSIV